MKIIQTLLLFSLTFIRLIFNQKEDLLFKQNFYSFCSICKSKEIYFLCLFLVLK